jgi:hypothetical protein
VPNYVERSQELAQQGVQVIACLSVNGEGRHILPKQYVCYVRRGWLVLL